jgi:hypothetical protein
MKNHLDFRFLRSRRNLLLATGKKSYMAEQFMNEERARSLLSVE